MKTNDRTYYSFTQPKGMCVEITAVPSYVIEPVSLVIEEGRHQATPVRGAPEGTGGPSLSPGRGPGLGGLPGEGCPPAPASRDPTLRNIWSPAQGWPSVHLCFPVSFLPALISCLPGHSVPGIFTIPLNAKFCSGLGLYALPALLRHYSPAWAVLSLCWKIIPSSGPSQPSYLISGRAAGPPA